MTYIKLVGFLAATLTTVAFIPQAVKTWKTKSTKDLSLVMFLLLFIGIVLWLIYGLLINDLPIIIANLVTLCFAGVILYYLIMPKRSIHIHHIAIWVNDIELIKTFYCKNFKAVSSDKYYNPKNNFSSYFISFSTGIKLEVMHRPDFLSNQKIQNHFALSLGSKRQVELMTNELKENGIEVLSKPRITGDGFFESVIKDPEGNLIELTV